MAQIKVLHYFFDSGVPARRRELRHICTRNPMPPRRRAFRSNDFGLKPTTIPRDAKRQAEPPSRRGTYSHQNHFRCNPSRTLVEPRIRFSANNIHPRLNLLPRRDCRQAHRPAPDCTAVSSGVIEIVSLRDIILSRPTNHQCPTSNSFFHIVQEGHPRHNPAQATKERSEAEWRHRHPLAARESASKRHGTGSPRKGGVGKKALFGELSMPTLCHHVYNRPFFDR